MSRPEKRILHPDDMTDEQLRLLNNFMDSILPLIDEIHLDTKEPPTGILFSPENPIIRYRLGMFKHTYIEFLEAME